MQGFYTVYRGVFEGLLQKEVEAAERAAKKGPAPTGFGRADSPWAEVSAFYQYWLQFVSDRHFAWADAHNLASAPNRKVARPPALPWHVHDSRTCHPILSHPVRCHLPAEILRQMQSARNAFGNQSDMNDRMNGEIVRARCGG